MVGGRQSTFLTLSHLDNELLLNDISYHSPKEIFPFSIFYESDSRDNLEENLFNNNFAASFMANHPENTYYLCGDEMFVEKILDGSNFLGPLTETGWNLYSVTPKAQKDQVGPDGFRFEITCKFDMEYPDSILKVPLQNTIFCAMHGEARVVEKLLNLEIERIQSEANIAAQSRTNIVSKEVWLEI